MENNRLRKIQRYCITALFASLIFVATAYLPRFSIGVGYVHIGDAFVYLAASLLPAPFAVFAAATGAALADLITGYAIWIPATLVIKGLTALCFTARGKSILCCRNLLALAGAALICCAGYYLYEAVIYLNFVAPLSWVLPNFLQSAVSAVLYLPLATVLARIPYFNKL